MGEREGGDSEKEDVFVCYSMLPPGWWFSCSVCLAHIQEQSWATIPLWCAFTSICFSCACLVMPTIECGCVFIVYYIVINMVVLATWWFILFIGVGNYLVLCCCNSLSLEIDCDIGL